MRKAMRKSLDKAMFRKTANRTKAINVTPMSTRGGIRL